MPYVLEEDKVFNVDTFDETLIEDVVGVYDTEEEVMDELAQLIDMWETELEAKGFVILDKREYGIDYCAPEKLEEMEKEGVYEGYHRISFGIRYVSEEEAESVRRQLL
ncbi:MAG: hypothetical protein ACPL3B_04950 [Fervidobacterium sp.]